MTELRTRLFTEYRRVQAQPLVGDRTASEGRLEWFRHLYRHNYARLFPRKDLRVLEIGCGEGWFVKVLLENGIRDVTGIDLSPEDVAAGRDHFGLANLEVADALDYLCEHPASFDVIFAKDVLEHVERDSLCPLLTAVTEALRPGGTAVFQVPNMDWVMSPHERYMDLTHEVGFTRESLAELGRLFFHEVDIRKVDYIIPKTLGTRMLFQPVRWLYLRLLWMHYRLVGGGADGVWFDCREIAAVCRKPRQAA
ncbi:MAG TPA: class I SAM-dependent methyltransferase [Planctomycetaceae bacterium]|nr:class I SAM-dependent methyltransferase [Planctomycetaceae bacterium]